ncbi:hypothetical protein [Neoaquamicrobium sediminum]|uniref:hypothetical protein n=1 Tax=Neoaquamicrobium sediminum TaxID=1849104 RepID=UPI001566D2DB|nr:hypothetical protein [Mesorhizobium sediminum]NRC56578.1 hypothetical protein [Mesorhizobium sediminum]
MLNGMFDCGLNNWLGMAIMSGAGFLVLLALLLAVAVLVKHLFWGGCRKWPETP